MTASRIALASHRLLVARAASATLFAALWYLTYATPCGGAISASHQEVLAQVDTQVSWGSANGCEQNIQIDDFGSLTPDSGSQRVEAFDASPHTSASLDSRGDHVWVGCVTSNAALASVDAQGIADMKNAAGDVLAAGDVAIGVTNEPGGQAPAGCAITPGQSQVDSCWLPNDGSTVRTLVGEVPAGTTELDWQYQIGLPANQPIGEYNGGEIIFTATAGESPTAGAPVNRASPSLSTAQAQEGSRISASEGSWTNSPTKYTYQWKRCNSLARNCVPIAGATSSTYTPIAADIGSTLMAVVTAANANGSGTAKTAASEPVLPAKPQNTALPKITTTALEEGVPLNASTGTWTGNPTSYSYEWQWCELGENPCGPIPFAEGSTYTPTATYDGRFIRVVVTARNTGGQTSATSVAVGKISPPTPVNTSLPTLSINPPIAATGLSASNGTWANSPTGYAYQWELCNPHGENCTLITGATSSTYTPAISDVANTLIVIVTASNAIGSASASSAPSAAVLPPKPQNTVLPTVVGSALEEGVPLEANNGTWTGSPTSYTYQWEHCDLGENPCGPISGAAGKTYTPTSTYVGKFIRVVVTAINGSGSATVTSRAVGKISPPTPVNTSLPVFSINPPIAATGVSVSTGTWTNSPTSYAYQWERCNSAGESCAAISGATSSSYAPVSGDIGETLLVVVTASNAIGSASTSSAPSEPVLPPKPQNTGLPVLSGASSQVGVQLSTSTGTWSGTPTSYAYQWQFCQEVENVCGNIAGATQPTFTPTVNYLDEFIRVTVTAKNASGEASATSHTSGKILPAVPVISSPPTLSNTSPIEGVSLSASTGSWTNSPTGYAYQWERCNSAGESCSAINGANAASYTPTSTDVADRLVAVVTASNAGGTSTPASSATSGAVQELPVNTSAPTLSSNTPTAGSALSVSNGAWSGYPDLFTYTYGWLRCNSSGTVCTDISGATNSTYTPTQADGGFALEAQVTANNTAGQATATTSASSLVSAPPASKLAPQLSTLAPTVEVPLSVGTGEWSGYPASFTYAYQWEDCNTLGQSCSPISGATGSTYTPVASDLNRSLVVQVTATNTIGGASLVVGPTNPVESSPAPSPTSTPTFTTTPAQGTSVGLANVAFSGRPSPSLTYQWRDCTSASLSSCTNISGATSATYTPAASDQGLYLSTLVTATNTYGGASTSVSPVAINATYMQAVEADHPVADWTFNDPAGSSTAADSAGWGALSGGTKTFGVPGPFTGSGTAVELTSGYLWHSGTPLDSPTVFSLELWFKPTSAEVAGDDYEYIIANQEGWIWLGLAGCTSQTSESAGPCLIFEWQSFSKPAIVVETGYRFTDTNWHYIVMTHGEDGFTHIYVNGVEYGPFNSSSQYYELTAGTFLGGVPGSFSHVAYYNTELASKRVAVHWAASKTS